MTKRQAEAAAKRLAVELLQNWINQNSTERFGVAFGVSYDDARKIHDALTALREELDPDA